MQNPLDLMYVTNPYGAPSTAFASGVHEGVDLRAQVHTPVYAIKSGWVLRASIEDTGYGTQIRLNHDNNTVQSRYAHLDELAVDEKDFVEEGQIIGYTGNTGFSTGPHLHFEIRVNGKPVDPINFIKNNQVNLTNKMIENIVKRNQQFFEDIASGRVAYGFDVDKKQVFRVKDSKRKYYNNPNDLIVDNLTLGVRGEDADKLGME